MGVIHTLDTFDSPDCMLLTFSNNNKELEFAKVNFFEKECALYSTG